MKKINRSYYAVIPSHVRYDEKLSANAKLLYGEITALSNEKGFCWASSNYFAELYSTTERTIRRWIKQLDDSKYIICDIQDNNIRKIFIKVDSSSGVGQKCPTGRTKKSEGVGQKCPHNNKLNITNNNSSIDIENFQKAIDVLGLKDLTENQQSMISKLIEKYPSRDYEFDAQKCKEWWFTHPRTGWKKPLLAFSNWLKNTKADDEIVKKKQSDRFAAEAAERARIEAQPVDPEQKKRVEDMKAKIREKFKMKK